MTFDPTQETFEEYLQRRSLQHGPCGLLLAPCDLLPNELILPHGQRRKTEGKTKSFGHDKIIHVDCPLHED
jgi:hypothetical protein|tara:strand:- start:109 stop:321 length:213 start_codon:yes stop_codon:yes gene_type:complete